MLTAGSKGRHKIRTGAGPREADWRAARRPLRRRDLTPGHIPPHHPRDSSSILSTNPIEFRYKSRGLHLLRLVNTIQPMNNHFLRLLNDRAGVCPSLRLGGLSLASSASIISCSRANLQLEFSLNLFFVRDFWASKSICKPLVLRLKYAISAFFWSRV